MMGEHEAGTVGPIRWQFFRAGGFDQVRLNSGAAILALDQLDQKLWAALSCPTSGIEFDRRTLDLIDADGDGRIRAAEIIAAVQWAGRLLKDPDILLLRDDRLPLAAIDDRSDEGRNLLAAARRILDKCGKADALSLCIDDVADTEKVFADTPFNGDGIVPPEAADDPAVAGVIVDIMACLGEETDRSGRPGISRGTLERFFAEAEAFAAWWGRGEADPALLPLGGRTAEAAGALAAVAAKVEDYFTRCSLAAFDERAAGRLNRSEEDWAALGGLLLSPAHPELAEFPLAVAAAGRPLPLEAGLNPAWAEAIASFRALVVEPVLGRREALTAAEWHHLDGLFSPYRGWLADKPAVAVDVLGQARIAEILALDARPAILELIARDVALEGEAAAIASVDRLLRYCRDLAALLDNFVAFRDFYTQKRKAVFQAGTLFLDGRSCELCVRVDDVDKHAVLASLSRIYLVYCDCTRKGSGDRITIAAAVTGGDSDQLTVGRNGVFYDRQGRDWDATVVRIIEHPISVRQAVLAPYKKLGNLIAAQLEKAAATRAKAADAKLAGAVAAVPPIADPVKKPAAVAASPAPATPPPQFDAGRFAGIFAAAGLALGAIGTAIASVVTGFLALPWWQVPLALLGLAVVVSGPSVAVASFKLRQRNLGPILDANGWAVNTRAKINIPFGGALTELAHLPAGATRSLKDPFAEKRRPWRFYAVLAGLAAAAALAWRFGLVHRLMG
jgi:hypothetical protein